MQHRPQRDQRGRAIANGGSIGDISADGGSIANLRAGITAQKFGKAGVMRAHRDPQRFNRHTRAYVQSIAQIGDPRHFGDAI